MGCNFNREFEVAAAVMKEIKENYNLGDTVVVSHTVGEKKVVIDLDDNGIRLRIAYPKKIGIQALYTMKILDKKITGISQDEFEEKFNEGFTLDEIIEQCSAEKLPGMVQSGEKGDEVKKKRVDREKSKEKE